MNGLGTHTWPDGRKFTGNYVDNKRHGEGVVTWANGR
jgi:hypothetical protein